MKFIHADCIRLNVYHDTVRQLNEARQLISDMHARHEREMTLLRETHEGHAVRLLENAQAEAERCERRYTDLMASYRMLKLQGAVEVQPSRVEPSTPVDPVEQAIRRACAGKDPRVEAGMRARVAADREMGKSDDQIIANIRRGGRPAEEMSA